MSRVSLGINSLGKVLIVVAATLFSIAIPMLWLEAIPSLILTPIVIYLLLVGGWLYSRLRAASLERLEIVRECPRVVRDGEEAVVRLRIRNRGWVGHYPISVVDHYPSSTRLVGGSNKAVFYLPPRSEVVLTYRIRVRGVGTHVFGPVYLRTRDVLSIYTIERRDAAVEESAIRCVPVPVVAAGDAYEASSRYMIGVRTSMEHGYSMEFKEIREYVPGDDTRFIDWKATARRAELMLREYYRESESDIVIVISATRQMLAGRLGERRYDYVARVAAEIVASQIHSYNRVGLVITGVARLAVPLTRVTEASLKRFTDTLARVPIFLGRDEYRLPTPSMLIQGMGVLGKTLYIYITDLTMEGDVEMISLLRGLGHVVYVISPAAVHFDIRELEGVERVLYLASQVETEERRREAEERLGAMGVPVVEMGPDTMFDYIMARFEEFRRLTPT